MYWGNVLLKAKLYNCNYVENILKYNQNAKNFYMALYDGSFNVNKCFPLEKPQVFVLMNSHHISLICRVL